MTDVPEPVEFVNGRCEEILPKGHTFDPSKGSHHDRELSLPR